MERRRFLEGCSLAGALAVAGCAGGTDDGEPTDARSTTAGTAGTTDAGGDATTTGDDATTTDDGTTDSGRGSYTVSMAPVGEVTFESVPERWSTYFPGYADMGVALGQADGLSAVGFTSRYHTDVYDELDGVSVDTDGLTQLYGDGGIDREIYIELDNDVHLTDPQWLVHNSAFGLDESAVASVTSRVAPFLGNTIFRHTDTWHDYRYYTMYEAFEKVAAVFDRTDQYEAFRSFHDAVVTDVETRLPPTSERPRGALVFAAADQPESFAPYYLSGGGSNKKQFRDLGVRDAIAGTDIQARSESSTGEITYEALLEIDPEVLLVRGHETKTPGEFRDTVLAFMENHAVASQLTAVQNGDVYRGGPIYAGPIQHLFLTERFANALYPDAFGGELFARADLAAIVRGEF